MERILILDNYDSFTYNLVHLLQQFPEFELEVKRNDELSVSAVAAYDRILLSPGPGIPVEAGILMDVVKTYGATKPILGVCLGHQGISEAYGAKLTNMEQVCHGQSIDTHLTSDSESLFKGLPQSFKTGRYHSWVVDKAGLPEDLIITADDPKGNIMAISHKSHPVKGIQFHPESILTEHGKQIIYNWLYA